MQKLLKILHQRYLVYILLALIVFGGFFIRIYQNTNHPAGFFCDEAGLTYEAYKIVTTGKDSHGSILPFYFTIFSPRGPVAIYDQIPFVLLFGLTEFTSRFAAAFFGTVTIIVVFFLAQLLFKNKLVALFGALLTALSPWHIQFSRFGTENIRLPLYFGCFLVFFLLGLHKHKKIFILLAIPFLFLGFYAYTAADVFIFPFILGLGIIYRIYIFRNKLFFLLAFGLILFCCLPFIFQMVNFPQQSRFAEVSVFKNKPINEAFMQMTTTYLESYSPDFLFFKGDAGMPGHFINRFSIKGFGELYLIALPFLLIGLVSLIKNKKRKENQLLLLWLFLYPIGSVVAGADGGGPFATRSIIGILVFQIITSLGIVTALNWIESKKLKFVVGISTTFAFLISLCVYLYAYFVNYPLYSEDFWGWQYGAKDIVGYFVQEQKNYDTEIMAPEFNAPDIFFKFYAPNDCQKCKIGLPQALFVPHQKQLFAVTPFYLRQHTEFNMQTKKMIMYPNGTIAFLIGEIKKLNDNLHSQ